MSHLSAAFTVSLAIVVSCALSGCEKFTHYSESELIQRAKDFEDKGNLKGSIIELKNVIQKNPNNPQARLLLGQIYLKKGMGHEAEKELTQAEKLGVSHESIQIPLGEALLLMGEYPRVLSEIQPTEKTTAPNLAYIQQLHADALLKQGKLKEACDLFRQSLDTYSGHSPTYWGLAQCAVADGDLNKAREWLNVALKLKMNQAKTWIFMGNLEQLQKNSQNSLAAYTQALRLEPNNLEALLNRAALYMALRQPQPAQMDVEKVSRLAPRAFTTYYLQGLLNFEQKKFPEARDAVQKVFQITPDHMPSVLLAGATAYSLGSYQQAESYLNRFLANFPQHGYARKVLAATQLKQKHPDKALQTLSPLLAAYPEDAAALALAGEAYLISGESSKAAQYLQKASAMDAGNSSIRTQLALSHLSMGDNQLGIAELAKAAALDPNPQKADVLLVMVHLSHKEYDKALAAIDALEKKTHATAATQTMRGSALLGKKDLSRSRSSFEQALALDPTYFPAAATLAQLDLLEKKPDNARKRFERILEKDKNNLQAMMALAELAAFQKQEQEYISWLEKAAKAHPQAITPQAMLVRHYLMRNESGKALALANEVVNEYPDNPVALDLLGSAQLAVNDKTAAINTFSKMVQKAESSPEALNRLASAQFADNQFTATRATLNQALKQLPNHLPSLKALIQLEMKENKPEKALQLARQIQNQFPDAPVGYETEGDIYQYQKQTPQAVKAFEQAMAKGAGTSALIKLHRVYSLAGNAQQAEAALTKWMQQHPNDLVARVYAAEYYTGIGRNQDAITQYQTILQQKSGNAMLLNNLAYLYQREGDQRARPTAEQAYQMAPDQPAIQDTLGWILVQQGQAQQGLGFLRKAISIVPANPAIRFHYAVALTHTGDKAAARKEFEYILRKHPEFTQADAVRAELQKLSN